MTTYVDVVRADHDATIYREWICEEFGGLLVFGGSPSDWARAFRHINKLAKKTGLSREEVMADAREDAQAKFH